MNDSEQIIKLVYIAGLGHSGSTLLDLLISSHSHAVSVGEIMGLHSYTHRLRKKGLVMALGNECTCGAADMWQCPFWTAVEQQMTSGPDPLSLKDLDIGPKHAPLDRFGRENHHLFHAVKHVSGKHVIVDSSKSPYRLHLLQQCIEAGTLSGVELVPIYLIRTPKATVHSHFIREMGWVTHACRACVATLRLRRILSHVDPLIIWYDDLSRRPEQTLRQVMSRIGLPFESEQMQWANRERHNLGGNKMRRNTDSTIRPDDRWKTGLGWFRAAVTDLITYPAMIGLKRPEKEITEALKQDTTAGI